MKELLESEQYKKAELKLYPSMKALAGATGVPIRLLKAAKGKGWTGFVSNNNVDWRILKPTFEANLQQLLTDDPNTIEALRKELLKEEIKYKALQNKKLEKNLIEPEEVRKFVVEIATLHSIVLKKVLGELPPKLAGLSEPEIKKLIDTAIIDIFNQLKADGTKVDELSGIH